MKRLLLVATVLVGCALLVGCANKPVRVYQETEKTERVRESTIVDPEVPPGTSESSEPEETTTTRTETEERVIEREPVIH